LKKPAKSGAANQELIHLFAKKLGIDCNRIKIIRGKTGKKKQLLLPDIADVHACICP
jgi:uncharacterized protein YggU (UPF0235/DUF167 family)